MSSSQEQATVIRAKNLTRRFGKQVAVDRVSFDVPKSAIFGFLGPNGSGKSTVIRMLCGVLRPNAGRGEVLGRDCATDSEAVKRRIGYMSQQFSLYAGLTVAENLDFYGRIYGLRGDALKRRKSELMELVSLRDRARQFAGHLSGGWKQRLALACALVHKPEVLFLDEPTAGIDPVARRQLWDLLFDLSASGVTLFVTTHYMDEAERCTHIGYIYFARLIVLGKPADLKRLREVTPHGTRRCELTCPDPAGVLTGLRTREGVRDATLLGETIRLLVDNTLNDADLLAAAGGSSSSASLRPIGASLEDVFVTLSRASIEEGRG